MTVTLPTGEVGIKNEKTMRFFGVEGGVIATGMDMDEPLERLIPSLGGKREKSLLLPSEKPLNAL